MDQRRKRARKGYNGTSRPEAEANEHSAKSALQADPSYAPDAPACAVDPDGKGVTDPEKQWLLDTMIRMGAESANASFDKRGYWVCRNGARRLGVVNGAAVRERDRISIAKLFCLRSAVKLRIKDGPYKSLLEALCRLVPRIKREITLGLMMGHNTGVAPGTWAYRRACEVTKEWNAERISAGEEPISVNTTLLANEARDATTRFVAWQAKSQHLAAPPWSKAQGFSLPEQGHNLERAGRRIVWKASLLGLFENHRQPQPVLVVQPDGNSAWATVNRLLSTPEPGAPDPFAQGEEGENFEPQIRSARVVKKDGKMMLSISYTRPRPKRAQGQGSMLVRRGMWRFLVAMTNDGAKALLHDRGEGSGLIAIKRQMHARRQKARDHFAHQGRGARGRGRVRFYRITARFQDKEDAFVKTWCQQQAAAITRQARQLGVAEVILEAFDQSAPPRHPDPFVQKLLRRFPFARLRDAVMWSLTKYGIPFREQALDYNPNLCPLCGQRCDVDSLGWATCENCDFEAWQDTVVCWHHFQAAGVDAKALLPKAKKEKRITHAVKEAKGALRSARKARRLAPKLKRSPKEGMVDDLS